MHYRYALHYICAHGEMAHARRHADTIKLFMAHGDKISHYLSHMIRYSVM